MATPKGMPTYAQGASAAIAASKKEAELTKKAKTTPLANAPAQAISNEAATANANINKYDVAKANQNAQNAVQKATIAKQVEKQAIKPADFQAAFKTATSATPSADMPLASYMGSAAKTAAQQTGAQQAGALNDLSLMAQQTYGTPSMAKAFEAAMPSNELPLVAYMGEAAKYPAGTDPYGLKAMTDATYGQVQKVAPSNVQSLGMWLGQAAKDVALSTPATSASAQAQLQNLVNSTYGEPAPAPAVTSTLGAPLVTAPNTPVYATGDVAKIQDYTASNVAPMTDQEKKDAFVQAVQKRMEVEKDLMGTRVIPPSSTQIQNRAIESVIENQQMAEKRIAEAMPSTQVQSNGLGAPPIPFDLSAPAKTVQETPPSMEKPAGVTLGEKAKPTTTTTTAPTQEAPPAVKEKIITGTAQDKAQNYADGFARADGYVWNATVGQWESPDVWQNTLKNREAFKAVVAPTATPQIVKGTPTEDKQVPDGFKDERGYTWNENAGQWESPDVWANTLANRNRLAGQEATFAGLIQDTITAATGQTPKTDVTPEVPFTPSQPEQRVSTMPVGEPIVEQPTAQEQPPEFDNYPSQYARAVVDKQITDANRQIDLQIAEAARNRDLQTAQNLEAYKRALNESRDKGFMQNQQLLQQMANRGILTSGLAADAQTRLQMSMNQNVRDIAVKNQQSLDKVNANFKTAFDKLVQKRQDLESNREGDVEKIVKGIQADNREMMKLDVDLRKLQLEENKNLLNNAQDVLKRYADQGYDTSVFEPFLLSGNVKGLARAMQQSGQPQLSLVGQDMTASINKTNADIVKTQAEKRDIEMNIKQSLSQIDKQRSDTTGFVFQNGVALKDKKGNLIPTAETIQNNAKLSLDQKRIAIDKQRADTARAKANSKSSPEVKSATQAQQLNFLQDTISTLVIPRYQTQFDLDGNPVKIKVGEELNPANIGDFNEIMADLWASGKVSPDIIQNQYRAFGLKAPSLDDMLDMKQNPDR